MGTSYNGPYGEAPPKSGTFLSFQVYKRVVISLVEVYKREGKYVFVVCTRTQKGQSMHALYGFENVEETFWFCDLYIFKSQCIIKQLKEMQSSKQGM